jgi:hypothetical protein
MQSARSSNSQAGCDAEATDPEDIDPQAMTAEIARRVAQKEKLDAAYAWLEAEARAAAVPDLDEGTARREADRRDGLGPRVALGNPITAPSACTDYATFAAATDIGISADVVTITRTNRARLIAGVARSRCTIIQEYAHSLVTAELI